MPQTNAPHYHSYYTSVSPTVKIPKTEFTFTEKTGQILTFKNVVPVKFYISTPHKWRKPVWILRHCNIHTSTPVWQPLLPWYRSATGCFLSLKRRKLRKIFFKKRLKGLIGPQNCCRSLIENWMVSGRLGKR